MNILRLRIFTFKILTFCLAFSTLIVGNGMVSRSAPQDPLKSQGEQIWKQKCSGCHGLNARGVTGKFDHPVTGPANFEELAALIDQSMPEDDPESCTGAEAQQVARYLLETFIEPNQPQAPRIELSHLTIPQYETSVAKIFENFLGSPRLPATEPVAFGLQGRYFDSRNFDDKKLVETRVDPFIDFDWKQAGPLSDKTGSEEFCVEWRGSVRAPDSGLFHFTIESKNGYRLFVNRMNDPLIDNWVSTFEQTEQTGSIRLIGGRWYPIRLELLKVKDPSVSVRLCWEPPFRGKVTIPTEVLTPHVVSTSVIPQTPFPDDDSSLGYPRGTLVSPEWELATTDGALEIANLVSEHLTRFTGAKASDENASAKAQELCLAIAELAFRRPLLPTEETRYIDSFFLASKDRPEEAAKGSLAAIFKSPWFLYVGLNAQLEPSEQGPSNSVREGLSLTLRDSAVAHDWRDQLSDSDLADPERLRSFLTQQLTQSEVRNKWRSMMIEWMRINDSGRISKDPSAFEGFDDQLVNDLQESALRFLEQVLWSDSSDFRQLFLSDRVWMNRRMSQFYGVDQSVFESDSEFRETSMSDQRAGLLTHPLLLSQLAYLRTTSPIHRGVFVTRNILGIRLNPPPVAVEPLAADAAPEMTTRQRVEFQTRPENCMSCHQVINPFGFALEGLDAVGRKRVTDQAQSVDDRVNLAGVEGGTIEIQGPRELAEYLVNQRATARHFVELVFQHATKQPIAAYGETQLEELTDYFMQNEFNMQKLIVEICIRSSTNKR